MLIWPRPNVQLYNGDFQDTVEMSFSRKRQRFLVNQGYAYKVKIWNWDNTKATVFLQGGDKTCRNGRGHRIALFDQRDPGKMKVIYSNFIKWELSLKIGVATQTSEQIEIATRWLFSNKRLPPMTLMLRRRGLELRMPSVLLEWVAHWLLIFAKSLLRVSSLQICLDFLCLIGKTEREHGEYVWGWWCCLLGEEGGQVKHF